MSSNYSQNRVSEAIWPWQEPLSGRKQALPGLTFSILTLLAAWTIGSILYFYNHTGIAIVAFSISTFVFIASRFFPKVYCFIEGVFQKFSSLVGSVLTWIFLLPFFYICFPIGKMVHILKKKDPMHRKFDLEAASYWQSCKKRDSVEDYKRQF